MCVTTDIGNPKDIHPTNKQDVGKRLAAIALNNLYQKPMVCSGPVYKSIEIYGNEIGILFENTGTGLFTPDKYGYIKGFEIAGNDKQFYFARAFIKIILYWYLRIKYSIRQPFVLAGWVMPANVIYLTGKDFLLYHSEQMNGIQLPKRKSTQLTC